MKRTFISVRIDATESFREKVKEIIASLEGEKIKWEDLDKLHITLAFIGETSEGTIKDVSAELLKIGDRHKPFTFEVKGTGIFKSIADPRILWAGISGCEPLTALQKDIVRGLDSLGIVTEDRPFKPHITLGRIKSVRNRSLLSGVAEKYAGELFMKAEIREVIFCESILRPEGALHIPVKFVALGKKG